MFDFRIYATMLDQFRGVAESDKVWQRYWGNSKTPPHTPEQFHWLKVAELIDSINRVPHAPALATSRDTAFNAVMDWAVLGTPPLVDRFDPDRGGKIWCSFDGFEFDKGVVQRMAGGYANAEPQYPCSGALETEYGDVEVYGYIDYLLPFSVVDVKTATAYEFPQYKHNAQHLVYLYALQQMGMDITTFHYDVVTFPRSGRSMHYTETYRWDEAESVWRLRNMVEDFLGWLTAHRELVKDPKVFGGDTHPEHPTPVAELSPWGLSSRMTVVLDEIKNAYNHIKK